MSVSQKLQGNCTITVHFVSVMGSDIFLTSVYLSVFSFHIFAYFLSCVAKIRRVQLPNFLVKRKIKANESKHPLSENFRGLRWQMLTAARQRLATFQLTFSFAQSFFLKHGSIKLPKNCAHSCRHFIIQYGILNLTICEGKFYFKHNF